MTAILYLSSRHERDTAKDEHEIVRRVQAVPQSRQEQSRNSRAEWSSVKADPAENNTSTYSAENSANPNNYNITCINPSLIPRPSI